MSGPQRNGGYGLFLSFFLAATAARADSAASYVVSGPMGAVVAESGNQPGAEALLFAFTAATPVKAGAVPGPRVVFSVTQWALANNAPVQLQWYGDWPLAPDAQVPSLLAPNVLAPNVLAIANDLTQGTLDIQVRGTLVASSAGGTVLQQDVPGRLQVKWGGSGDLANTTVADSFQTSGYTTALQIVGQGRLANAAGTITVPALGAPISLAIPGSAGLAASSASLAAVATGLVSVTTP